MDYGRAIRVVRAARRISQAELARRSSIDQTYVSMIEKGIREPNPDLLAVLVAALDVPLPLLQLLAADSSELNSIDEAQASALALELLALLAAEED